MPASNILRSRIALLESMVIACVLASAAPAGAETTESVPTRAARAIIVDSGSGVVLIEKNADEPVPPASLGKLMTVYMVFERLKDGRLSLDDRFLVSRKAWRTGGSKTFVGVGKWVRVEDLLRGTIVQSGNDACIVIAEGIGGSEQRFAEMMTKRAREIGLTKSMFRNATGLPRRGHVMTARDLAIVSRRIIEEFPEFYTLFAERSFTYSKIKQRNRNSLLYQDIGADGLKTGYTSAVGYGLAGSASRDGRRVIVVLLGLKHHRIRAREGARLVGWVFLAFETCELFQRGATLEKADVWLGARATLPLVVDRNVTLTIRPGSSIRPPLGRLIISVPGRKDMEVQLVAGDSVDRLGPMGRLSGAIRYMLWGESG